MRSVAPIPKGLLGASDRIRFMEERVSSADSGPVASIPTPPAFETAATNSAVDIHDIPGKIRGYWHPKRDVMRFFMAGNLVAAVVDMILCMYGVCVQLQSGYVVSIDR
mmetsp:Transcript_13538/g.18574  ORF Transcript_13538/g.18574 Transcript_13538/m.18574 type:complete len:108 (-) Transcript_13538:132-455(-)